MTIPVYVVTGFLDAGKTTFLNSLLNRRDWRDSRILLLQFEAGEEEFQSRFHNCTQVSVAKKQLEQEPDRVAKELGEYIKEYGQELDEIWVEWNGVVAFSQLQALFLAPSLREYCTIHKAIHIADSANIEHLLGRTGGALPEQIASSDFVIIRSRETDTTYGRIRKMLRGINPRVPVYPLRGTRVYGDLYKQLVKRPGNPMILFAITLIVTALIYLMAKPVLDSGGVPVNTIVNVFLGIILQAIPFLLIGVLLSSAIQVLVPQSWIERHFPKSLGLGMVIAIVGGFCLPVCDCASIPIFRSLVKKGVPLSAAVTFMTAAPVINPVVILSTYYAFAGNMSVVAGRIGLGIVSALLIGLVVAIRAPKGKVLSGGGLDRLMCSCGCYEDVESVTSWQGKLELLIRHSQAEFFDVGRYLLIGSFVAACFQAMGTGIFSAAQSGAGLAASMIIMIAMAFLLSLCSSSDAVVARSFARQFPMGAIMAFLVFGPMMDVKNMMMLSSGFSRRFIGRLLATAFAVCFVVVFLFYRLGGM